MKTKKPTPEPPMTTPPVEASTAPKPADLDAEFHGLVGTALLDCHVARLGAVVRENPTAGIYFMPVGSDELARAAMLARDVAMKERSACLDIMRRVLGDPALASKVSEAICAERGQIMIPMSMKFTWNDIKGWTGDNEYKLAV